jgi:hypothetical protein
MTNFSVNRFAEQAPSQLYESRVVTATLPCSRVGL